LSREKVAVQVILAIPRPHDALAWGSMHVIWDKFGETLFEL
jgi:hypothetical protein